MKALASSLVESVTDKATEIMTWIAGKTGIKKEQEVPCNKIKPLSAVR
ncbi:hypothetical protein ACNKHO_09480 [Shigella flexneri]